MLESVGGESILTQNLLLSLLESSDRVGEHEANEGEVVQFGQSCCQSFIVAGQSSKACNQAQPRSTTQRRSSKTKPCLVRLNI